MARFQRHCVCTVLSSVILYSASNCTIASDNSIHSRYLKLTLFMQSSQKHHLHHGAQSRSGHNPHMAQGMHITQWQNPKRPSSLSQLSLQAAKFGWFGGWDAYAGVTVCLYEVDPFLYVLTSPCQKYWSGYMWLKLPDLLICSKGTVTDIQQKWYGISAFSPPKDLSGLSSTPQGVKVILNSLMFSIMFFEILRWNAVYYYYYYICHDLRPKGTHHALLTIYKNPFITIQMLLPLKHNTAAVYQQTVIL